MAISFDTTSTDQFLETGSTPVNALPLTLSAWVYVLGTPPTGATTIFSIGSNVGLNDGGYSLIVFEDPGHAFRQFRSVSRDGGRRTIDVGPLNFAFNTWHHVLSVFNSSQQIITVNGVPGLAGSPSKVFTSSEVVTVGHFPTNAGGEGAIDAYIAECAIWDVSLSDADALSLAIGELPYKIRPQNLKYYAPLIRHDSGVHDILGLDATATGGPTTAPTHPPMIADRGAGLELFTEPPSVAAGDIRSIGGLFLKGARVRLAG